MPEVPIPQFERLRRRTRVYDTNRDNLEEVIDAVRASLSPTGSLQATLASSAPEGGGWLFCDGSFHRKADYPTLYAMLGGTYGETEDSFGLPDLQGRLPMGTGGMGAPAVGAFGGAPQVTLTVAQLPSHGHGITDPGHTHAFAGDPHAHGVTDPGHSHGLTETEHTHGLTDPGHVHGAATVVPDSAAAGAEVGAAAGSATDHAATGASVDPATVGGTIDEATTGVSVDSATAGGTNASSTTGVTVDPTGEGAPVDIIPPVVGVNWLVRT
ncbi:phage tail protein [Salipiger marinus]|uniref:phage tail protein n=1 Tax=Salipiger marinus TaxID=555512 RepID=UPI004059D55C